MSVTIQIRRDTAANWTSVNPVLHDGELGYEKDTGKAKIGNGTTAWNSLSYWSPGSGAVTSVNGHTGAVVLTNTDVGADASGAAATAQAASLQKASNLSDVANVATARTNLGLGTAATQNSSVFILASAEGAANGVATLDSGTKVPVAQIPTLSQYAPTGLTGAQAATSYAGGTVSGHPLTGTWSAGQWVVDQTGKIYVCVTGGTPGTWRRVGKDPWQFFLDDYCKGDGKQALVTVTNGSLVINTTPLSAPSAPVPTTAATGGTVLAGVYGVIVTYTNRWGETVGSTAGTITTTGSTSTITVPTPASSGNATGWNAYLTQAGGSTYTKQNATPMTLGAPLVLTAPPTNTGTAPPGSDSSAAQIFTSTAVDGGKNVMICGALGTPGAPLVDTIATVNSPTQAVLSSVTATASQAGCAMVFSSDDRMNVDQCVSDARAYAVANNNFCQVIGGDKNYGLGSNMFQSQYGSANLTYNTQVRVPVANSSGQTEKLEVQFLGPGDNAHAQFWVSEYVNLNGCTFLSYAVGPNTADPTFGQQSVIGGPTGSFGTGSNGFSNTMVVIKGVQVVQPGWSNSIGIDLQKMGGCRINASSQAFAPTTNTGGGVNPSSGWLTNSFWQNKIDCGMRLPDALNNDDVLVESFATEGLVNSVLTGADHLTVNRLLTINTYFGVVITGGDANTHDITIHQWSFENVAGGALWCQSGSSAHITVFIVMDGENTGPVFDIKDTGNVLHGTVVWSDPFRTAGSNGLIAPILQGAQNLRVINTHAGPGIVPPVIPLTYAATINTNASLGNVFTVTLTGATATIANPTVVQDGQIIRYRLTQDATGGRLVTWGTAFDFGSGSAPTLSSAANKVDIVSFEYNAALGKWMYLGSGLGY
jgi:hypothetical protein